MHAYNASYYKMYNLSNNKQYDSVFTENQSNVVKSIIHKQVQMFHFDCTII